MVVKSTFHGAYHYYENINGKVKKVEKAFTDKKKYDDFMKKNPMPMPSLGSFFGLGTPTKKALPVKKAVCKGCAKKKIVKK